MNETAEKGERLAKVLARAGVASRREAEVLIRAGRIEVDGKTQRDVATNVLSSQRISFDGEPLPKIEPTRLYRFHKARGVLTTAHDPQGRTTLAQVLPPDLPRLMPVGRLDINSEGLLLLTNDGGLKRRLELPAMGWTRRYRVRAHGRVNSADLQGLMKGITVEGVTYGPIQAAIERSSESGQNLWLAIALKEGKNREIRRVLAHLGLDVSRLIRVAFGPFQLGALKPGEIEELPPKVVREQLGEGKEPGLAPKKDKDRADRRRQP